MSLSLCVVGFQVKNRRITRTVEAFSWINDDDDDAAYILFGASTMIIYIYSFTCPGVAATCTVVVLVESGTACVTGSCQRL
jgi:hypothetical protein